MSKLYAVSISGCFPECDIPVLVNEDGTATNRFADGTIGVPNEWQSYAEEIFDGDYPEFNTDTGEWHYLGKPLHW